MNRTQFQQLMQAHYEVIVGINNTKGHDYAGEEDALANLTKDRERVAKIARNNPDLLKWYVFFEKHLSAVMTFLEEGDVKSEPIEGRIHDLILYEFLLLGLIKEKTSPFDRPELDPRPQG